MVVLGNQDTAVDLSGEGVDDWRKTNHRTSSAQRSDVDSIIISANVERLVGEKSEIMIVEMQHSFAFHYLRPKFVVNRNQVRKKDYRRNRDALIHFGPPFMEGKAVSATLLGFLL